jgi:transcriptional regulator with XRE-family HTH domain
MISDKVVITGRLIAAARVLTGISRADLANSSGISISTLAQFEAGGAASHGSENDVTALRQALERFGVMFIPEGDGIGAGVRLRFLRQDVKQIGRLEGEGGMVGDDDVP